MRHDVDDPPPKVNQWGSHWYYFKVTLPTNLFWLVVWIVIFKFIF